MKSKKTTLILNILLIAVWLFTGVATLLSDNVSKLNYGTCLFILILILINKTVSDDYHDNLWDNYRKLLKSHMELLKTITTEKEEKQ